MFACLRCACVVSVRVCAKAKENIPHVTILQISFNLKLASKNFTRCYTDNDTKSKKRGLITHRECNDSRSVVIRQMQFRR